MQSPSMVKVPLICSTPVTASMEMFNYLNEKSKKIKDFSIPAWYYDKEACMKIESIFENEKKDQERKAKDVKRNMIVGLYKVSAWEYLTANSHEREN